MAITLCRRLFSGDKQQVLDLIQTRIDSFSNLCLTDNRVNKPWVDEVMSVDDTYDLTHRVFGMFVDDALDTIFVVKLLDIGVFSVSMMMSTRTTDRKHKVKGGYGEYTAELLDYGLQEMERGGFHTFYSVIPDHPKWKKAEENPNRPRKDVYDIEVVEKIPAGQLPTCRAYLQIMNRPFSLPMMIRRMTLRRP